jgi:hypothetical protein
MKETIMRRTLATVALLMAVGMMGCSHADDPKVATAHSGAPSATAGTAAGGQNSDLKYSQCMRDHGLEWFPDPGPDGGLGVRVPAGTDQNTLNKAEEACKAYNPATNRTGKVSQADLDKIRQESQCIRDHGFPKYPDPDANGTVAIDEKNTGISPDDEAFEKARQECQKYAPPRQKQANP